MKSQAKELPVLKKIEVSGLPRKYKYRYTIEYILRNFFSVDAYERELVELQTLLNIGEKMLRNYRFVLKKKKNQSGNEKFVMTEDKLSKLAKRWKLNIDDLIA